MVCEVIIDKTKGLNRTFDYLVPKELEEIIKVGMRVVVDFNNREKLGLVLKLKEESSFKELKTVISLIDLEPIVSNNMLKLVFYLEKHYFATLEDAISVVIPSVLKYKTETIIKVNDRTKLSSKLNELLTKELNEYKKELRIYQKEINEAIKLNYLELINKYKKTKLGVIKYYKYLNNMVVKGKKINELLNYLKDKDYVSIKTLNELGFSNQVINRCLSLGGIRELKKEVIVENTYLNLNYELPTLNDEQEKALNKIDINNYKTYLLYGVTSSGKTLVYLKLIEKIIKEGKEAIVLVPEIMLTSQIAALFKQIFKESLALIHSKLTEREKLSVYERIKKGEVKIVLGPRSALFVPFNNLGVIIIDEEQEKSYIQEQNPTYDARVLAAELAKMQNIPLLLVSATPRIISFYKALNKEYELLTLTKRATLVNMPKSIVVDMREELKNKNVSTISNALQEEIKNTLENNKQVIIFINKRGYASAVMCRDCGHIITCPNCSLPLTYHRNKTKLICHLCGYEEGQINICPQCGSRKIRYVGLGTEKITADLVRLFPKARILRVDSDSVGNDYNYYYEKINNNEVDIIVGTQMLAKGLDFKDVALVGIINADTGLYYPTYDAYENNFMLLEQVSGRSGRKDEGRVVFQTYNPDNYVIKYASNHDYLAFYNEEIKKRKLLDNPPFKQLLKLTVSDVLDTKALMNANILINKLNNLNITILGPSEAIYFKNNNKYNYDIYIKFIDFSDISYLNEIIKDLEFYVKINYL